MFGLLVLFSLFKIATAGPAGESPFEGGMGPTIVSPTASDCLGRVPNPKVKMRACGPYLIGTLKADKKGSIFCYMPPDEKCPTDIPATLPVMKPRGGAGTAAPKVVGDLIAELSKAFANAQQEFLQSECSKCLAECLKNSRITNEAEKRNYCLREDCSSTNQCVRLISILDALGPEWWEQLPKQ